MHPTSVIGALIEPAVVWVPGRDVVSVCAPELDDPGCCSEVEPGFCVPLCTGDCVGDCEGACADAATAIDNSAAIDDEAITRFLICSSGRAIVEGS